MEDSFPGERLAEPNTAQSEAVQAEDVELVQIHCLYRVDEDDVQLISLLGDSPPDQLLISTTKRNIVKDIV